MNDTGDAVTWADFEAACGDLAQRVQQRFEAHPHAVMATIRADGSPRLSGMEAPIRDGHLWLGMDSASVKARDLRRDPRFGLHSTPDDEDLAGGDARIDGRVAEADDDLAALFAQGHHHEIDDPTRVAVFTAKISRAVLVRVEAHHLVVETWMPSGGLTERRIS